MGHRKSAIQNGGVLQYKLGVYCSIFKKVGVVGVSDILLNLYAQIANLEGRDVAAIHLQFVLHYASVPQHTSHLYRQCFWENTVVGGSGKFLNYRDLLFLAFNAFLAIARKTHQKNKDFLSAEPRKILGKKGRTLRKNKELHAKANSNKNPKQN